MEFNKFKNLGLFVPSHYPRSHLAMALLAVSRGTPHPTHASLHGRPCARGFRLSSDRGADGDRRRPLPPRSTAQRQVTARHELPVPRSHWNSLRSSVEFSRNTPRGAALTVSDVTGPGQLERSILPRDNFSFPPRYPHGKSARNPAARALRKRGRLTNSVVAKCKRNIYPRRNSSRDKHRARVFKLVYGTDRFIMRPYDRNATRDNDANGIPCGVAQSGEGYTAIPIVLRVSFGFSRV